MVNSTRRFYRTPLRRQIIYSIVGGCLLARIAYVTSLRSPSTVAVPTPGEYRVENVVDACHLEIAPVNDHADVKSDGVKPFRIRIIGIAAITGNVQWQRIARESCSELCQNRRVRIRLDKRRLDTDQVWLAHVYVQDELLSYLLVERGMVAAKSNPSDSPTVARRLVKAQATAQQKQVGFWTAPRPDLESSDNPISQNR